MTDLTEKLAVLNKKVRQDSEYVSGIDLIKKKKKARLIQKVLRKKNPHSNGPSSENIRLKTRLEPD